MSIVLDANILVAASYARESASRRVLEACLSGELTPLASPPLAVCYAKVLKRAVRARGPRASLEALLERAEWIELTPAEVAAVRRDEAPAFAAAEATALHGRALAVVTADLTLLRLEPFGAVRTVTPGEFALQYLNESAGGGATGIDPDAPMR